MPAPTAPVINSVVFAADKLSATIKFIAVNASTELVSKFIVQTAGGSPAIADVEITAIVNTEVTAIVSGLSVTASYTFRVGALNADGTTYSAYSAPLAAPSVPVFDATSPVVMAIDSSDATLKSATIKFTPGANPLVAGENVQKFVIEAVPALASAVEITGAAILNGDMTKVISGLSANVSYIFRIQAVSPYGSSAFTAYSAPVAVPVEVNLNVEITATGELELLSQQLQTPSNVVCATEKLPAAALYLAGTHALIEFWEDDAIDGVKAQLADSDFSGNTPAGPDYAGYYLKSARELAKGLQLVLCGEMHANKTVVRMDGSSKTFEASPFIGAPYNASGAVINDHKIFNHFGRMALACYAHYLMGHQQATAAITNDKSFMAKMLDLDIAGLTDAQLEALLAPPVIAAGATNEQIAAAKSAAAAALYAKYANKTNVENANTDPRAWALTAPAANANADLARRLVAKLLSLNLTAGAPKISTVNVANNNVPAADSGSVADIVDQVIGRDASRARSEDNSKYGPESHGLLRFYAGDVVYVNIKLAKPTVTVNSGQRVDGATIANQYSTEENYTIRIELA
jgi:hypothetical protein